MAAGSDWNVKPFCFADDAAAPVRANFPPQPAVPNPNDPLLLLSSIVTFFRTPFQRRSNDTMESRELPSTTALVTSK